MKYPDARVEIAKTARDIRTAFFDSEYNAALPRVYREQTGRDFIEDVIGLAFSLEIEGPHDTE